MTKGLPFFLGAGLGSTESVEGRSSLGRMGLFIQNAGWVDPGFKGDTATNATKPATLETGAEINRAEESVSRICEAFGATKVEVYADLGAFLIFIESKWGFFILLIMPCFFILLYEIEAKHL